MQAPLSCAWLEASICICATSAGNIHANHQAGLLFIDFDTGATLQVSGRIFSLCTSDFSNVIQIMDPLSCGSIYAFSPFRRIVSAHQLNAGYVPRPGQGVNGSAWQRCSC